MTNSEIAAKVRSNLREMAEIAEVTQCRPREAAKAIRVAEAFATLADEATDEMLACFGLGFGVGE